MLPSGMLDTHATVGKTQFLLHSALVVTPAMLININCRFIYYYYF